MATRRSITGSKPSYTTPIAPLPRVRRIWYLPSLFMTRGAGESSARLSSHLYLESMSHTAVCTSRCTMVSSPTPPLAESDTPITLVALAPTSIFSSL